MDRYSRSAQTESTSYIAITALPRFRCRATLYSAALYLFSVDSHKHSTNLFSASAACACDLARFFDISMLANDAAMITMKIPTAR